MCGLSAGEFIVAYCAVGVSRKRQRYPVTDQKAQRVGGRSIALLFLDLGARRGGWSAPHSDRFTPGKHQVPTVQEAG
jgi:hypothetical protein